MWCSKIKNNQNDGLPNHWNLEGWKFEDAIWMHRTRHNVKIGNKKKQEKTSRKCVSCNPSSLKDSVVFIIQMKEVITQGSEWLKPKGCHY